MKNKSFYGYINRKKAANVGVGTLRDEAGEVITDFALVLDRHKMME